MGVTIRQYYTICCDRCDTYLEDYTGELRRITEIRSEAEKLAITLNWWHPSPKKWYCPECSRKMRHRTNV